jgi:hypothetical protein
VPAGHEANSVLPLIAAVLNKLQSLGVRCEARPDEARRSLIIEVFGATLEQTDQGRKRFIVRAQTSATPEGEGQA